MTKLRWGGGGGTHHTLPIRVCAAQRGRDFEAPDLERFRTHESSSFVSSHYKISEAYASENIQGQIAYGCTLVAPFVLACRAGIIGRFTIDDGDGSENVTFKMSSRFFKLCRAYSNFLKMSNVGEFPWS